MYMYIILMVCLVAPELKALMNIFHKNLLCYLYILPVSVYTVYNDNVQNKKKQSHFI